MNWHLTWQDPIALALCVLGLGLAWWLRRRVTKDACGCDTGCGPDAVTDVVPTEALRLGRARGAASAVTPATASEP